MLSLTVLYYHLKDVFYFLLIFSIIQVVYFLIVILGFFTWSSPTLIILWWSDYEIAYLCLFNYIWSRDSCGFCFAILGFSLFLLICELNFLLWSFYSELGKQIRFWLIYFNDNILTCYYKMIKLLKITFYFVMISKFFAHLL